MSINKGIRSRRRVEIDAHLKILVEIIGQKALSIQELHTQAKAKGINIEMYALRNLLCKNNKLFRCFKRAGVYVWKCEQTKENTVTKRSDYSVPTDVPDVVKAKYGLKTEDVVLAELKRIDKKIISKGIAAYIHEQNVILRLLRKRGQFNEIEFDNLFCRTHKSKRISAIPLDGNSFILGNGGIKNSLSWWIDLLRYMIAIGLINTEKKDGLITYTLANG